MGKKKPDERLNEILGISPDWKKTDIALIDNVTCNQVTTMMIEGYLDPEEQQNDSPTAEEFGALMYSIPNIRAHGYVIGGNRPDARVTITGLMAEPRSLTEPELIEAMRFCRLADEFEAYGTNVQFWAWWD